MNVLRFMKMMILLCNGALFRRALDWEDIQKDLMVMEESGEVNTLLIIIIC